MGIKKVIINIILGFVNLFVRLMPIKSDTIAFVSLESNKLESDLKLLYDALSQNRSYRLKTVLIHFDKNTLWTNFLYLLNCIKQIVVINTSHIVIITDNNYVISRFKREGVIVIEVWHAAGAIKKFGNAVKREYPIANYDYVIANSDYWKKPYALAFNVPEDHVVVTGMPRVDHLSDAHYLQTTRERLLRAYPQLQGKRILLYAPTFRGNIYRGFHAIPFDARRVLSRLDDDVIIIYKFHPLLLNTYLEDHERIIDMHQEDTHDLFTIADALISDYSSIIFDYSLLDKPMYFFVPDLEAYCADLGCFVDYLQDMPGPVCFHEDELAAAIKAETHYDMSAFKKRFFTYDDGCNTKRIVHMIDDLMKT